MAEGRSEESDHEGDVMQVSERNALYSAHSPFLTSVFHSDEGNEQSLVLSVVRTLTECPVTCNALLADDQQSLLELCSMCLGLEHHTAASQAVRILTGIVSYCQTEKIFPPVAYMAQIDLHMESLIYASLTSESNHKELANYLLSGVKLSEKNVEFADRFALLVGGILADDFGEY